MSQNSQVFWLKDLTCEDEAQSTGVAFEVISPTEVLVTSTYSFPEYETPGQVYEIEKARDLYRVMMTHGRFELHKR